MKTTLAIFGWCLVVLGSSASSLAQPCTLPEARTWIAVSNAIGNRDTLWFGFDSLATCDEDPPLCEIGLAECCGPPGNWFCLCWINLCGVQPVLIRYDFRAYVSPTDVDTHRIGLQAGEGGVPVTLRWNRQAVSAICDSAVLRYWSGVYYRQRMDLSDSLVITDSTIFQIQLFRYGQRLTPVQVIQSESDGPATFALFQNYPNPFNPSTTIRFALPKTSHTVLKVYDLLGQEVATLVNETFPAGTYEKAFSAEALPSGVYFYRLSAGRFVQTRKLLLLR